MQTININGRELLIYPVTSGVEWVMTWDRLKHKYTYLFTTKDVTESEAAGIVSRSIHTGLYMHHNGLDNIYCYKNAIESLYSLLTANKIDTDKNYAILEKI